MARIPNEYSYKEAVSAALKDPTDENVQFLADWFEMYGQRYWNGECYLIDGFNRLFPIYKEVEEDEFEIVGWEIK